MIANLYPPLAMLKATAPLPATTPGLLAWWDASVNRYTDSPPATPAAYGSRVRSWVSRAGSAGALAATAADDAHRMLAVGGGIDGGSGPGLYADDGAATETLTTTLNVVRPYTIFAVGTAGQNAYVRNPILAGNASASNQLMSFGGGATLNNSQVDSGDGHPVGTFGTTRVMALRCDVSGSSLWVDGSNHTTNGAPTADFGTLLLNSFGTGSFTVAQCAVYGRVLTDDEVVALTNYFAATTLNLIVDGNSLSVGYGVGPTSAWPYLAGNVLAVADPKLRIVDVAVVGQTTVQRDAAAATAVDARYNASASRNVLAMWELTNHIFAAGATQAQAYAANQTYGNNRKAAHAGMKIVLGDCLRRSGNAVTTVNGLLAADFTAATSSPYAWLKAGGTTYGDMLIQFSAVPQLADETNLTYFQSDQTHLTAAGYQIVADTVRAALALLP